MLNIQCCGPRLQYIKTLHNEAQIKLPGGPLAADRHQKCKIMEYDEGQTFKCGYGVLVLHYGERRWSDGVIHCRRNCEGLQAANAQKCTMKQVPASSLFFFFPMWTSSLNVICVMHVCTFGVEVFTSTAVNEAARKDLIYSNVGKTLKLFFFLLLFFPHPLKQLNTVHRCRPATVINT